MASRSRLLLVSSLGGLLLLAAVSGVAGLVVLGRIHAGETLQRSRFLERSNMLQQVRNAIYLSGTLARDCFADPDGPDAPALTETLAQLNEQSKQSLDRYAASGVGGDAALANIANLRGEVAAYWKVLSLMDEMAHKRRTAALEAYFRGQLAQRRRTMIHVADDIGIALDGEWRRREQSLDLMYGRFHSMLVAVMVLVVIAGAAVSAAAVGRLMKLEGETRALSGQLVQAQEQERRSIARELHDEAGQSLTALLLDVGAAAAEAGTGTVRARLDVVAASAERIVEEVRRIALSLRPSMLDDLGLVPALEWQAREVAYRSGLTIEVQAEESAGQLPEAHRTCIYRIVQEALRNTVRHAGAGKVRIGLQKGAGSVTLQVEDDGKGFAVARLRGLGLLGMEERVSQLGGRLRVLSEPGRGTKVTAELPL